MKKLLRVSLLVFYGVLLSAYLSPCFSDGQLQAEGQKYVEGRITDVNFVRSTISVKFVQSGGDNDEITFSVTQHTQIVKGDLALSISELKKGSLAIVKYRDNPGSFTHLKADYINIKP